MPSAPQTHRPAGYDPGRAKREHDARRGSASERGYDGAWQKAKRSALQRIIAESCDPFCRYCRRREATTIDHALPVARLHEPGTAAYSKLFWNEALWIPSCIYCNTEKRDRLPDELSEAMRHVVEACVTTGAGGGSGPPGPAE